MKARGRAAVGVVITVLLLWWVLGGVSLEEVWTEVRQANLCLLGLGVTLTTVTFFLRALRWRVLLHPIYPGTTLRSRFAAVNIGFMANNLLPARVGEFARAYALARLEPISVSGSFGSLVVERFLDGLTLLLFVLLVMAAPGFPADASAGDLSPGVLVRGVTLVLGVLLAAMVALVLFPGVVMGVADKVAVRLPGGVGRPAVDALKAFLGGLNVFRNPGLFVQAVIWSLLIWAWQATAFWAALQAFGIRVGFGAALFVNGIIAFAVSVPAAPGFFGTFQAGALLGLGVYGVAEAPAVAFSLGFHLGGFVPVTVIGLYYAWRLGLSLREVEESETRVEEAVEMTQPGGEGGRSPVPPAGASKT
jgi:glycosyltransferase 2 family protein